MSGYRQLPADAIQARDPNGRPEAMLTWVRLPDGRIRLYASRNLPPPGWGQRTLQSGGVDWHIEATMRNVLIVDRDTARRMTARRTRCAQS